MNEFWKWMENNGYGRNVKDIEGEKKLYVLENEQGYEFDYTNPMLIGYMYEYINELIYKLVKNKIYYFNIMEIHQSWQTEDHYKTLMEIIKKL